MDVEKEVTITRTTPASRTKNKPYNENQSKGTTMENEKIEIVETTDVTQLIKDAAIKAAVTAVVGVTVTALVTFLMPKLTHSFRKIKKAKIVNPIVIEK